MTTQTVRVEGLSEDAFGQFGRAVGVFGAASPDLNGLTWHCWYPIARVPSSRPMLLGIVETEPLVGPLTMMERHAGRTELVLALDQPIIQAVARSTPDGQNPDAGTVRAFVVQPGEAVVLAPGTWHAAGMPMRNGTVRYMFGLPEPDPSDQDSGWVPIAPGGVRIDTSGPWLLAQSRGEQRRTL